MKRLEGKVCILTGASSGMGKASAIKMAEEGAKMVIMARRVEKLKATAEEMKAVGGEVLAIPADVSKHDDWKNVVKQTVEKFGKIDVLVNNAGVGGDAYTDSIGEGFSAEAWKRIYDINLMGPVYGIQEAIPYMQKNGGGSIINVGSISSIAAMAGPTGYTASKGAILSFTRALAGWGGQYNIRANCLLPGIIITEINSSIMEEDNENANMVKARWNMKTKLPKLGVGNDIAGGIVYLASDESSFVTGTELVIDGGYVID